jgi:hypothetical protein
MRKDYNVRLRLSALEGEEVRRISLAEGRSQADTLSRIVRDGLKYRRGEVSAVGKLAQLIRGEAHGYAS